MTTKTSTDISDHARRAALEMVGEGLATLSEVARLAGVDRQLVRHWAMRAGINVTKSRAAWVGKAWRVKLKRVKEA
jgi:transposase-like protein